MEKTNYDEASRYLARKNGAPMMRWLTGLNEAQLGFDGFLDSVLTLPNSKQRVCDAVARLRDLTRNEVPVAGLVEFQTEPDPDMFGRMMLAGGICWMTVKPTDLPGDRYELCAIVVNLTGQGDCARQMQLGASRWSLTPVEVNLSTLDAGTVLDQVESGEVPHEVLAWIPVMKRGDDPAILQRWLVVAGQVEDLQRRGDFGLAVLFANAVGRKDQWEKALEGLKMKDVSIVLEWKAAARREGKLEGIDEGKLMGKVEALLFLLRLRFKAIPEDLTQSIQSSPTTEHLEQWMTAAAQADTLQRFRQDTGL